MLFSVKRKKTTMGERNLKRLREVTGLGDTSSITR